MFRTASFTLYLSLCLLDPLLCQVQYRVPSRCVQTIGWFWIFNFTGDKWVLLHMDKILLKTTTLNNAMDKLGCEYSVITVVLKACHRTQDSGKCPHFIKDRHSLPFFTEHCLCQGTTLVSSSPELWTGNSKTLFGKYCKIIDKWLIFFYRSLHWFHF